MVNIFGDRGKEGSRGERGPIGPVGRIGPVGPKGDVGEKGVRGPRGQLGATGPVGSRGPRGGKGADGRGGIDDICRWLPTSFVLEQFRRTEAACFLITDVDKDVVDDPTRGIILWKSRSSSKRNAVAVRPCKHVRHISDHRAALLFDNSLYNVDKLVISPPTEHSYVCICVTFQVNGSNDQWLVLDWLNETSNDFRGISASSKEIRVWGAANGDKTYMPIEHETKRNQWTTILVEWSNIDGNLGRFIVNDKEIQGVFTCKSPGWFAPAILSIGARFDGQNPLSGAISALEIYSAEASPQSEKGLPDALKNLIIHNQIITPPEQEQQQQKQQQQRQQQKLRLS